MFTGISLTAVHPAPETDLLHPRVANKAATEVTAFAVRPFSARSGGERARVTLARVLAQPASESEVYELPVEVLPHPGREGS